MLQPRGIVQIGMGWFSEEAGGLNRMYAGLLGGLRERGVRVDAFVAGDAAAAPGAPHDVRFFARRDASLPCRLAAVRRVVKDALRGDVGVIAAHFAPYALPVLDVLGGRPLVMHFHGPWAEESSAEREGGARVWLKRRIERAVYRRARRFVVLSAAFGDLLMRRYSVPSQRIEIVPGGVDARRFAAAGAPGDARAALGLPTGRPIVGTVRRLVRRVGIDGLLDALAVVRTRVPDVLLAIAGTGPRAAELAAAAAARGLDEHVRWLGFVADDALPRFYRACDLTIVPSVALEGFGLTTIESLAAGTPVLVTPVGGLPETVRALDRSLVLPDASAASIAAVLTDCLRGAQPLPSAASCAAYARAAFDWPVIAARTLEVYGRA